MDGALRLKSLKQLFNSLHIIEPLAPARLEISVFVPTSHLLHSSHHNGV